MRANWRTLALIQMVAIVTGSIIFLVSFFTLHWSEKLLDEGKENETLVMEGIWKQCVVVNGTTRCDSLVQSNAAHWHRHMQAWQAVGVILMTTTLILAFVGIFRTTRQQLSTQIALNFGTAISILIGTATIRNNVEGELTYSYQLAILSTTIFFIAAVLSIAQYKQFTDYVEPTLS